jgi:membrane protease YdiL (CAAX protease family)
MMLILRNLRYYAPSIGQSLLLVLIFVFLGSFLGAIPKLVAGNSVFWGSTSVFYICAMLPVFVFIYFKVKMEYQKYEVVELNVPHKINSPSFGSLHPVLVFFLAGLATLCISVIIEPLVTLIPMPDSIKELFEMLFYKSSPVDLFISVIILAPLCEEFLCRGMMLRGMLEHISPTKAILWSAFLFALLHLNPWQAIPAFALGAFFGWVYWKSRSIWLVIFLHFVNNFSAMIIARLFPDLPIDVALSDMLSTGWYAFTYAVAIILFTCITLLFIKKLNSTDGQKTLSAEISADSKN